MKTGPWVLLVTQFSLFFLITIPFDCAAQEYARQEVTAAADLQTFGVESCVPIGNGPLCRRETQHWVAASPSFTYSFNLSPSLALEGTVLPSSPFLKTNSVNSGHETLALGGVKTGWRGDRWGFYGDIQVGVGSFSCGDWYYSPKPYSRCQRLTNFALLYGGTVEYRLSRRWALRADAGHLMMPEFDEVLQRGPNWTLSREARMIQHLDARIGVTRSFGSLRETGREPIPPAASWEVGAMFALQPRTLPTFPTMSAYPSLGIWWSWNISRYVSWDSTVMHSGRTPGVYTFSDYQAGGRALEILTGTKIGIRRDHMGYFAKIRGGTITFGETERQLTVVSSSEFTADRGMFTSPVLDAGGVLEVYPSRHCILRFDAGSATIFYQPKDVYQQGIRYAVPGETQPTMLMSFGAGFRF